MEQSSQSMIEWLESATTEQLEGCHTALMWVATSQLAQKDANVPFMLRLMPLSMLEEMSPQELSMLLVSRVNEMQSYSSKRESRGW